MALPTSSISLRRFGLTGDGRDERAALFFIAAGETLHVELEQESGAPVTVDSSFSRLSKALSSI